MSHMAKLRSEHSSIKSAPKRRSFFRTKISTSLPLLFPVLRAVLKRPPCFRTKVKPFQDLQRNHSKIYAFFSLHAVSPCIDQYRLRIFSIDAAFGAASRSGRTFASPGRIVQTLCSEDRRRFLGGSLCWKNSHFALAVLNGGVDGVFETSRKLIVPLESCHPLHHA